MKRLGEELLQLHQSSCNEGNADEAQADPSNHGGSPAVGPILGVEVLALLITIAWDDFNDQHIVGHVHGP